MSTLKAIQRQILEVDELLASLNDSAKRTPRHSVFAQIRFLEKEQNKLRSEFDAIAGRLEQDVCHYAIKHPDRPTVAGVAAALAGFQNVFSELYAIFKPSPSKKSKGKAPADTLDTPQFAWGYEFDGSLGIAMTLPVKDGLLWNDPYSETAIRAMFEIARAKSENDISRVAREFGPPAIVAVHRWADTHVKNGYGVNIDWLKNSGSSDSLTLLADELVSLRDHLARTNIQSKLQLDGYLFFVDYDSKECRIRADNGRVIKAMFDTAITEEQAARVPHRYNAIIQESKLIVSADAAEPESEYFITEIVPL